MEKIIYIAVEGKARELNGKILLSAEFIRRGFRVIVGSHSRVRELAKTKIPGILIDKDFSDPRKDIWKEIQVNGGKIYALDEEGIVFYSPESYVQTRIGKNAIDIADGLLLWGEDQEKVLHHFFPYLSSKNHVVGNPRFDLLGKNAELYYGKEKRKNVARFGNYLLVNTNFARRGESGINIIKTFSNNITDTLEKQLWDRVKYNNEYYEKFVEGIKLLAQRINQNIVIRPHPADDVKIWQNDFSEYNNVHIIRSGDSNEWNLGAELIIHNGCTTAIEAYETNKVSILYQPVYDERFYLPFPNNLSDKAETPEQLYQMVDSYLNNKNNEQANFFNTEKEALIRRKIFADDHKYAVEKIANVIEQNIFDTATTTFIHKMRPKDRIFDWRNWVQTRKNTQVQNKFDYTSVSDIKKSLLTAKGVLHIKEEIAVKRIDSNVFFLKKK